MCYGGTQKTKLGQLVKSAGEWELRYAGILNRVVWGETLTKGCVQRPEGREIAMQLCKCSVSWAVEDIFNT